MGVNNIYKNICKVIKQNDSNDYLWLEGLGVILISLFDFDFYFTYLYFTNLPMAIVYYCFNLKSFKKSFSVLAPARQTCLLFKLCSSLLFSSCNWIGLSHKTSCARNTELKPASVSGLHSASDHSKTNGGGRPPIQSTIQSGVM